MNYFVYIALFWHAFHGLIYVNGCFTHYFTFSNFFISNPVISLTLQSCGIFQCFSFVKSSVEYPSVTSKVHSPKRQDQCETNLTIKRKQSEQRLGIHELLCNRSGMRCFRRLSDLVLRATPIVEFLMSKSVSNQDAKIRCVYLCKIQTKTHEQLVGPGF